MVANTYTRESGLGFVVTNRDACTNGDETAQSIGKPNWETIPPKIGPDA
jgi:hypothetical protein